MRVYLVVGGKALGFVLAFSAHVDAADAASPPSSTSYCLQAVCAVREGEREGPSEQAGPGINNK